MEELKKYGVFYDDDYDYMQHLRDVDELYAVDTFAQRAPTEKKKVPAVVFMLFVCGNVHPDTSYG